MKKAWLIFPIEGPASFVWCQLVCVAISIYVEGGVDASTPSFVTWNGSFAPHACSSSPTSYAYCCCSNHVGASSIIGDSYSILHLDNMLILSKEMVSTSGIFSSCLAHSQIVEGLYQIIKTWGIQPVKGSYKFDVLRVINMLEGHKW